MANLKHVGRLTTNNRRLIVAYRVLPGDPDNCLVVHTESLDSADHDDLIKLVESNAGQSEDHLAIAMARTQLQDGRNMLSGFHTTGKLVKVPTEIVELTPNNQSSVNLKELNEMIAQQQGVTVADLAPGDPTGATPTPTPTQTTPVTTEQMAQDTGVITDEDLAAQYRSQADSLFKEAKRLREQAEELVPTKRKSKAKESVQ